MTHARHRRHGQPRSSTLIIPVFRVTSWNFPSFFYAARARRSCKAILKSSLRTNNSEISSDLPRPRRSAQSAPAGCQPHSFETLGCVIKIFPSLVPPPPLHLNCALRVQGFRLIGVYYLCNVRNLFFLTNMRARRGNFFNRSYG